MKKLTLKTSAEASRKDAFTMNPTDIQVIWEENPRDDYGGEEYEQLKELIRKDKEIHYPVYVTPRQDGTGWKLCHGYRRLRCIQELAEEGIVIESIPVKAAYNEEDILLLHITLNNSTKALTDIELAKTIREYSKMTGIDSPKTLSEKTGINYAKVRILLGFDEMASTVLKEAVKNDEVSFTAAAQIVQNTGSVSEQNEVLSQVKEKAVKEGKKRATGAMVESVTGKAPKISKDLQKLRNILCMNQNYAEVVRVIDCIELDTHHLFTFLKEGALYEA